MCDCPNRLGGLIELKEATNATITVKFRTTTSYENTEDEEIKNEEHINKAILDWQGGEEPDNATVHKRDPGINKSGKVVINDDGTKTVNWTINFNTNKNIIHNFEIKDNYTPTSVTVSNIKITSGEEDVTNEFTISDVTDGVFTVSKDKLDAKQYKLTYSTTLSPEEEKLEVKNTAAITYTGGEDSKDATIPKPELKVQKEAVGKVEKTTDGDFINWKITANKGTDKHLVNLVNPILTDTIPKDQKLVHDSIKVERVTSDEVANIDITANNDVEIETKDNFFEISLPNGAYQYIVTFQTEILEYPSVGEDIGIYTNETTLINAKYDPVSDDAWINYFADGSNNNNTKTGKINEETENIDWEATVNPLGLIINNATITDKLSNNQYYVIDDNHKIVVKAGDKVLTEGEEGDYKLVMAENKRSFTITFNNEKGQINQPIKVSYSTRLNPELIGNITVTNSIKLTGGQEERELSTVIKSARTSQWFYGGGGSGRLLDFKFNKVTPDENALSGAKFKLERVDLNGKSTIVNDNIVTGDKAIEFKDYRAGRYILTETAAPEGYAQLNPIYFAVGYTETEDVYQITIMDSNWKPKDNPNATAEGNLLTVTNDYKPVSRVFEANKTLTGLDLKANQFEFQLLDGKGTVVATAKNDENGDITFPKVSFEQPGTYFFKMREVKGELGGISYDDSVLNVAVVVIEGTKGLDVESVTYQDGQEFKNTYTPAPTKAEIKASKSLNGQSLSDNQFEFLLLDSQGIEIDRARNKANGSITFKEIEYEEVGEYKYTIQEVQGTLGGVSYDTSVFNVKVTVTDNEEGQLVAKVSYPDGPVQFTNIYEAGPGAIVLEAEKILNGKVLQDKQFEFELLAEDGQIIQTVTNNTNGQVIFNEIEYSEAGTYKYTIREKTGNLGGITYDETEYPVIVTVVDGGEGFLVATANYVDGPAVFTNEYNPAPGGIVLQAKKTLEGQELINGQFTFTLTDETGEIIQTVTNNAEGQVIFDEITYTETGKHTYIIKETKGVQGGVTYDTTNYTVVVDVTDDGEGNLVATANYIGGPAVFTNTYTPDPDSVVIEASKILEGQDLRNGQFTFELVDEEGGVLQTKTNNSNGQIIFDEISYETGGEYRYTIREVQGSQGGVTYDDSEYRVLVTVTDNGEGTLTAEVEYLDGPAEFTNTYTAGPGSIVLEAKKILKGQNLRNGQFTFELVDEEGEILQIKQNNSNGQIIFDEISYETGGEYRYTIREVQGSQGGVTYDDSEYRVLVTVTDNGEGTLTAEVDYIDGPIVFENTYEDPSKVEDENHKEDPEDPKDPEDTDGLPKTGESTNIVIPILGFMLVAVGFVLRKMARQ